MARAAVVADDAAQSCSGAKGLVFFLDQNRRPIKAGYSVNSLDKGVYDLDLFIGC